MLNYIRYMIYTEVVLFPWRTFARIVSPIANSTLYAAIWMQFILAINRFWAISYPMTYGRIFNLKNVRIIILSLWSFSMLITVLYYNGIRLQYFHNILGHTIFYFLEHYCEINLAELSN